MIYINLQLFADNSDKTEKATPKKRQDLRKKGQVLKSKELPSSLLLLILFISIKILGRNVYNRCVSIFNMFFSQTSEYNLQEPIEVMKLLTFVILEIAKIVAPFFIIAIIVGVVSTVVQIGFLFTTEPIRPKFSHLNPISGLKRMFSTRSLFELLKSIVKVIIIGWIAWNSIQAEFINLTKLMDLSIGQIAAYLADTVLGIGIKICFALLVIAGVDYFFQWRKYEKDIRMSKQEIKEEYKQMEGNPEIKSRIKQKQREISMRRMLKDIPKADVVITNPTHYAVAIKYEPDKMPAPYVLAKGVDYMAQRIKEIAKDNNVHMTENVPLAQALYNTVEIGEAVPPELYKAVAEVLAFVYSLEGKQPV
ncbi:MAG: flagellar biosynthesis protein FlhB [Clostridiaceae bacterium]|jgi:flagellar biosynthetic protein FlhB|nr:flagellar biosynthesis protein FlhB [Clostridiaceae bacterium]